MCNSYTFQYFKSFVFLNIDLCLAKRISQTTMYMNPSAITIVSEGTINKNINFWFTCSGTVVPGNSHR